MLANPQQIREITCPERHSLIQTDDLCQLYEGQAYTENVYFCDPCRAEYNANSQPASHCKTCGFDMCPDCYEAQKLIQINCPIDQSRPLLKVRALQLFSNYDSNDYGCRSCGGRFDSSIFPSAHCRACAYDLCPNCSASTGLHQQSDEMKFEQSHQIPSQSEERPKQTLSARLTTCPSGHCLEKDNELKRIGFTSGGILALQSYICKTCNTTIVPPLQYKYSCKTCFFDICKDCYNNQKKVEKMLCPNSHRLMIARTLKEFAKYESNNYRCSSCHANLDSIRHSSAHCSTCNYDLCPNCVIKNKPQENKNNRTQEVTCPSRHNLSPVNNFAQLHPTAEGVYVNNMYFCDTCRVNYNCETDNSYHCQQCGFDICPSCYQKDQKVYIECQKNHPLYIVSNLKANHEGSSSYPDNTYVCQICQGSWDAAFHPSCHCAPCKFDLCPTCFEARNFPSLFQKGGGSLFQRGGGSLFPPIIQNTVKYEETKNKQVETTRISLFPQLLQQQGQGQQNSGSWTQNQSQSRVDFFPKMPLQQVPLQKPEETQAQRRLDFETKIPLQQGQQNTNQLPQQQTQPRLDFFTGLPLGQTLFQKPEETKSNQSEPEKKELSDEILCVLCLDDKRNYLFNPCNHLCTCEKCAIDLMNKKSECPICRNPIQSFTKVFMS